jgi:hypothetical protein
MFIRVTYPQIFSFCFAVSAFYSYFLFIKSVIKTVAFGCIGIYTDLIDFL